MILNRLNKNNRITSSSELQKLFNSSLSHSGIAVTPDSAMRTSAVYACVRVISESIAQLPLIFYQRDGRKKDRNIKANLYTLLHDAPNDFQTSFSWRETKSAHLCLRGNAYSFINRSSQGEILELLPMHPDRVKAEQNKDYSISYEFTDADGAIVPLRQDQVLRITGLSFDHINGMSPIAHQAETVGLTIAADRHSAWSFKNGAKLSGILRHPNTFKTNEIAKRVRESWDESFSGEESYKTPLLEEGMEWQQVSMSNKDAQYIEQRKFGVEDIARIYRVPPHKIGHLEKATNNNIEQQALEFVTDTLMPWLKRWEQSIMRDLIPKEDRARLFAEFLVDGLLRGDSKARSEFYNSALDRAWMSPNEVREKENMNPREGGDEYLRQSNMEPSNANPEP